MFDACTLNNASEVIDTSDYRSPGWLEWTRVDINSSSVVTHTRVTGDVM